MYPILFDFGFIKIYSYGVLLALGFFISLWLGHREALRAGLDSEQILSPIAISGFSGIFGAKLLYVVVQAGTGQSFFDPVLWFGSGLVFYGVPLVAFPVFFFLVKRNNLPAWKLLDIICICFIPAQCLGRIGCFLAGCCHGCPTTGPLGVRFTSPFADLTARLQYVHPVQLYESFGLLVLFLFLFRLRRKRPADGVATAGYLVGYGLLRFALEFFRGDPGRGEYALLSTSQWISLLFVAFGFYLCKRRQ